VAGLTLDSGALIAFERVDRKVMLHLKEAELRGLELTIPTAVIVEVWRGEARSARVASLLSAAIVEPLSEELARRAGEALATVKGASVVDVVVMSSAAQRNDRVLTADLDDLQRLQRHFPNVRLVRV
jgi:predicted nucleic acid-binding protein